MFICPLCGGGFSPPGCPCGYNVTNIDGIWQFTDDPCIVTQGEGDHYIGYEEIGEAFSGGRRYVIEDWSAAIAKEIVRLTGDGVFLDLGCGDGCFTVPVAGHGTKVIAGDISNNMMRILQGKASHNRIALSPHVTLCRINALYPPIMGGSIQSVVCNSVLHLISRPEKVIREIHRVLAGQGCFIVKDDMPGTPANEMTDANNESARVCNGIHQIYWVLLRAKGYQPKRYNWKYDREGICSPLFSSREEIIIPWGKEKVEKLKDGFWARFAGKVFSDQVDVPAGLHIEAIAQTLEAAYREYGRDFTETEVRWTEPDMKLTVYRK
jgi:SAM-dependent methyltransferase